MEGRAGILYLGSATAQQGRREYKVMILTTLLAWTQSTQTKKKEVLKEEMSWGRQGFIEAGYPEHIRPDD